MNTANQYIHIVTDYYRLVDAGDYLPMYQLFSDNIIYQRCEQTLTGMKAFRHFYEVDRQISGQHTVQSSFSNANVVVARGMFVGKNRRDQAIQLDFADFFEFDEQGLISKRTTYLANGFDSTT